MEASGRARRLSVGEVVGETFSIYGRRLGVLLLSAFLLFLVVGILTSLLTGPSRNEASFGDLLLVLVVVVIRVAALALYTGFLVRLVQDVRGERRSSMGDLLSAASPAIPALVVMGIVYGIAVGIGLVLLVIPGLILLTIWAVAAPAIVLEGAGPIEALGRSRDLVRGQAWTVFWTIVVLWLISLVATWLLGLLGDAIDAYGVGVTIAAFLTAPIHALAASVMFFDLGGSPAPAAAAPAQAP